MENAFQLRIIRFSTGSEARKSRRTLRVARSKNDARRGGACKCCADKCSGRREVKRGSAAKDQTYHRYIGLAAFRRREVSCCLDADRDARYGTRLQSDGLAATGDGEFCRYGTYPMELFQDGLLRDDVTELRRRRSRKGAPARRRVCALHVVCDEKRYVRSACCSAASTNRACER